jgi:hypothetical protein
MSSFFTNISQGDPKKYAVLFIIEQNTTENEILMGLGSYYHICCEKDSDVNQDIQLLIICTTSRSVQRQALNRILAMAPNPSCPPNIHDDYEYTYGTVADTIPFHLFCKQGPNEEYFYNSLIFALQLVEEGVVHNFVPPHIIIIHRPGIFVDTKHFHLIVEYVYNSPELLGAHTRGQYLDHGHSVLSSILNYYRFLDFVINRLYGRYTQNCIYDDSFCVLNWHMLISFYKTLDIKPMLQSNAQYQIWWTKVANETKNYPISQTNIPHYDILRTTLKSFVSIQKGVVNTTVNTIMVGPFGILKSLYIYYGFVLDFIGPTLSLGNYYFTSFLFNGTSEVWLGDYIIELFLCLCILCAITVRDRDALFTERCLRVLLYIWGSMFIVLVALYLSQVTKQPTYSYHQISVLQKELITYPLLLLFVLLVRCIPRSRWREYSQGICSHILLEPFILCSVNLVVFVQLFTEYTHTTVSDHHQEYSRIYEDNGAATIMLYDVELMEEVPAKKFTRDVKYTFLKMTKIFLNVILLGVGKNLCITIGNNRVPSGFLFIQILYILTLYSALWTCLSSLWNRQKFCGENVSPWFPFKGVSVKGLDLRLPREYQHLK